MTIDGYYIYEDDGKFFISHNSDTGDQIVFNTLEDAQVGLRVVAELSGKQYISWSNLGKA